MVQPPTSKSLFPGHHEESPKAGYETDADESELSEWESGNVRQGSGSQISVATTAPVGGGVISIDKTLLTSFGVIRGTKGSWRLLCENLGIEALNSYPNVTDCQVDKP